MLLSLCRIINRYTCYVQSKPFKQEVSHTVIPPLTKQVSILWIRYLYLIVSTKSQISISERILGDLVALLWPNAQLAFLYVVTPILQLFSINYPTNRASWNDYTNKMTHFYFRAYSRRPRNAAPLPSGKPEDALRGHRVTIQYVPKQFT